MGKDLCSECISIAGTLPKYSDIVHDLHEFHDSAHKRIRNKIDSINSMRQQFQEIKRALILQQEDLSENSSFQSSYETTKDSEEIRIEPENMLRKSSEVKLKRRRHIERSKKISEIARKLADRVDRLWNQVIVEKMRGERVNKNATVSKQVVWVQKNVKAKKGYMCKEEPQDMNNNTHQKGMEVYNCLCMRACFLRKSR